MSFSVEIILLTLASEDPLGPKTLLFSHISHLKHPHGHLWAEWRLCKVSLNAFGGFIGEKRIMKPLKEIGVKCKLNSISNICSILWITTENDDY